MVSIEHGGGELGMRVGDMVGYSNGDGQTGVVLNIWSEWAEAHYYDGETGEETIQTSAEILWDDGEISDHDVEDLEVIDESG